jgi:hypothetical protein
VELILEPWNLRGEVVLAAYLDTGGEVEFFGDFTWRADGP